MSARLFVEQLTVIDCALLDPGLGLVGESFIVDLELEGELDAQSMVLDFGEVKRGLKRAIDAVADHRLLVPALHPGLQRRDTAAGLALRFEGPADGPVEHVSPPQAVALIDAERIDAQTLARALEQALAGTLPANVRGLRLGLRQEAIAGAQYRYVHGLRKHQGLCQRIAHGHRSRLEVRVDGARDAALEAALAGDWRDCYLGSREDAVAAPPGRARFEYRAAEGPFALELPAARCQLVDGDSTVERLAAGLAARAAQARPGAAIEVRAYEGLMKGAIARC